MRIALDTIGRAGRDISVAVTDDWAKNSVSEAIESQPSALDGCIEIAHPQRQLLQVRVDVRVNAAVSCDRCGEPVTLSVHAENQLFYRPLPEDAGDRELVSDDLDVGWYADGVLDLSAVLAEAVALAVPARNTCNDAEACDARTDAMLAKQCPTSDVGHPGFAALRTINE